MSYKKMEIWKIARDVSVDIHYMTSNALSKFEMYEEGSQIRRSSKSIRSNIVEGYGRRHYKQDFIRFCNSVLSPQILSESLRRFSVKGNIFPSRWAAIAETSCHAASLAALTSSID